MFDKIDCGASNRSTMFVKALTQIGTVDVVSFSKDSIESNLNNCNVIFQKYITNNNVSALIRKFNNIKFLFCPWNPYAYYRIDKLKKSIIRKLIEKEKYDYVACRYIEEATTTDLLKYSDRLILDVDDNLVSAAKRDMINRKYKSKLHKWIANKRAVSLGVMSEYVLRKVSHSFYSNINESPYCKSVYLPNISMQKKLITPLQDSVPKNMLIVGWLDFYPNRDGALHFVKNVFPLIRKQVPDAELYIAGKCSDIELSKELSSISGVNVLGYVNDISALYEKCGVVIVPVYQGAGTSVKFVEGLMMNRPIVSTPLGVRGFEDLCKPGVHYLLANDDISFSENVVSLLNSVEKAKSIVNAAYEIGQKYFSEENFINIVKSEVG